jgi:DNA-binding YbaB/EbfC family protein
MNINPFDLVKQMGAFQEKLAAISETGSAGGGMVEIELNGKMEVIAVKIAPEIMESGDVEMLQDLILAAFSRGIEKIRETVGREMGAMAGGLNIPGLSDLMGMS